MAFNRFFKKGKTPPRAGVSEEVINAAYRLFLNRTPAEIATLDFATFPVLINNLFHSPEFRKSPRAQKNDMGWPESQYFIARDKKVLYCPIGKNACSFFKQTMVKLAEHPHQDTILKSIHMLTDHVNTGMQLSDYTPQEAGAFLADPEIFKFAILRDPARRLLSAYIEKFVKNREEHANVKYHTSTVVRAVQRKEGFAEPDFHRGISFRDMVEFVTGQPPQKLDPHWRPQYLYLGSHDWPHLYTFDTLPQAVADLEALSGMKLDAPPVNQSGSGVGQQHPGADQLLPEALDQLPMITVSSFLTPEIDAALRAYYAKDYALIASVTQEARQSDQPTSTPKAPAPMLKIPGKKARKRKKTIIHLHLPKTAGSSLTKLLLKDAKPQESITLNEATLKRLTNLPLPRQQKMTLIFGHLNHGAAKLLSQRCHYVSVLREPGPRLLSFYRYVARIEDHPLYKFVHGQKMSFGDFLEFIDANPQYRKDIDNRQVRQLAGDTGPAGFGREPALLRRALHNVFAPNFTYGLTEYFDNFQKRLVRQGLLSAPESIRENTADVPGDITAALADLTPAQRALYDTYIRWDAQLYDICKTVYFSKRKAKEPTT